MKTKETGVYQLENGNWEYRFTITKNGKKTHYRKRKDESGNVFKTQSQAKRARTSAIKKLRQEESSQTHRSIGTATVRQVFEEYCETGRFDKAYTTIKKQDSLWKNHLSEKFGDRYIDDLTVAEINDYLSYLYYNEGRAYGYVEAFLKMFYLIFGQAYSRDYLDIDNYSKLCLNKGTKIHMPKMKTKSAAKKRFSVTGSGRIKRKHAYHSHILTKKSIKRKRILASTSVLSGADEPRIREMI